MGTGRNIVGVSFPLVWASNCSRPRSGSTHRRMATPQEVATVGVFLSSSAASFSTGTNLVVNGALTRGVQL